MIKVCHLTSVHNVNDGRIFKKQCSSLAKAGYDVYLIAPNAESRELNNVKIIGVSSNSKGRLQRMLGLTRVVYRKALEIDADIYQIHDPELMLFAIKLKRKGKIVIYDSHEDFPQQIKSKEYIPAFLKNVLAWLIVKLERYALSQLDAVLSVSPNIVERLKKINSNTFLVTNYPIAVPSTIERVQNEERIICFAGQISKLWMHENILSALLRIDDVKYLLAGPVDDRFLAILKKHEGWHNVIYLGKVQPDEVLGILSQSKIGLALYDYSAELGYNIGTLGNTKLFEYMQAGLPIICTDYILWKQVVQENNCGLCVNPRDIGAISGAIEHLLNNPDILLEMGRNAKICVQQKYNWETQEKVLLDLYRNLCNKNNESYDGL